MHSAPKGACFWTIARSPTCRGIPISRRRPFNRDPGSYNTYTNSCTNHHAPSHSQSDATTTTDFHTLRSSITGSDGCRVSRRNTARGSLCKSTRINPTTTRICTEHSVVCRRDDPGWDCSDNSPHRTNPSGAQPAMITEQPNYCPRCGTDLITAERFGRVRPT